VPKPWVNLTRFHGVFAPSSTNARRRSTVSKASVTEVTEGCFGSKAETFGTLIEQPLADPPADFLRRDGERRRATAIGQQLKYDCSLMNVRSRCCPEVAWAAGYGRRLISNVQFLGILAIS